MWAEGVALTATGFSKSEKHAIHIQIESAGGRYTPTLSRRCTHLLVDGISSAFANPSEKLATARANAVRWNLAVVDIAWLIDCAAQRRRLPEADYGLASQTPPALRVSPDALQPHPNDNEAPQLAAERLQTTHADLTTRRQQQQRHQQHEHQHQQQQQQQQRRQHGVSVTPPSHTTNTIHAAAATPVEQAPHQTPWTVHYSQLPLDSIYVGNNSPPGVQRAAPQLTPFAEEHDVDADADLTPQQDWQQQQQKQQQRPWMVHRSQLPEDVSPIAAEMRSTVDSGRSSIGGSGAAAADVADAQPAVQPRLDNGWAASTTAAETSGAGQQVARTGLPVDAALSAANVPVPPQNADSKLHGYQEVGLAKSGWLQPAPRDEPLRAAGTLPSAIAGPSVVRALTPGGMAGPDGDLSPQPASSTAAARREAGIATGLANGGITTRDLIARLSSGGGGGGGGGETATEALPPAKIGSGVAATAATAREGASAAVGTVPASLYAPQNDTAAGNGNGNTSRTSLEDLVRQLGRITTSDNGTHPPAPAGRAAAEVPVPPVAAAAAAKWAKQVLGGRGSAPRRSTADDASRLGREMEQATAADGGAGSPATASRRRHTDGATSAQRLGGAMASKASDGGGGGASSSVQQLVRQLSRIPATGAGAGGATAAASPAGPAAAGGSPQALMSNLIRQVSRHTVASDAVREDYSRSSSIQSLVRQLTRHSSTVSREEQEAANATLDIAEVYSQLRRSLSGGENSAFGSSNGRGESPASGSPAAGSPSGSGGAGSSIKQLRWADGDASGSARHSSLDVTVGGKHLRLGSADGVEAGAATAAAGAGNSRRSSADSPSGGQPSSSIKSLRWGAADKRGAAQGSAGPLSGAALLRGGGGSRNISLESDVADLVIRLRRVTADSNPDDAGTAQDVATAPATWRQGSGASSASAGTISDQQPSPAVAALSESDQVRRALGRSISALPDARLQFETRLFLRSESERHPGTPPPQIADALPPRRNTADSPTAASPAAAATAGLSTSVAALLQQLRRVTGGGGSAGGSSPGSADAAPSTPGGQPQALSSPVDATATGGGSGAERLTSVELQRLTSLLGAYRDDAVAPSVADYSTVQQPLQQQQQQQQQQGPQARAQRQQYSADTPQDGPSSAEAGRGYRAQAGSNSRERAGHEMAVASIEQADAAVAQRQRPYGVLVAELTMLQQQAGGQQQRQDAEDAAAATAGNTYGVRQDAVGFRHVATPAATAAASSAPAGRIRSLPQEQLPYKGGGDDSEDDGIGALSTQAAQLLFSQGSLEAQPPSEMSMRDMPVHHPAATEPGGSSSSSPSRLQPRGLQHAAKRAAARDEALPVSPQQSPLHPAGVAASTAPATISHNHGSGNGSGSGNSINRPPLSTLAPAWPQTRVSADEVTAADRATVAAAAVADQSCGVRLTWRQRISDPGPETPTRAHAEVDSAAEGVVLTAAGATTAPFYLPTVQEAASAILSTAGSLSSGDQDPTDETVDRWFTSGLSSHGLAGAAKAPSPLSAVQPQHAGNSIGNGDAGLSFGSAVAVAGATVAASPTAAAAVAEHATAGGGLLGGGAVCILDPLLPQATAEQVRVVLATLGCSIVDSDRLDGGASVVVCAPQRATVWLPRAVSVISPTWLLRVGAAAVQKPSQTSQRTVSLSPDVSRWLALHLRNRNSGGDEDTAEDVAAAGNGMSSAPPTRRYSLEAAPATASSPGAVGSSAVTAAAAPALPAVLASLMGSKQGRTQLLQRMQDVADKRRAVSGTAVSCGPPDYPPVLLDGISWSVRSPPKDARIFVSPEADEEADVTESQWTMSQGEGRDEAAGGGRYRALSSAQLHAVVFKGASITLLLPADGVGVLGYTPVVLQPLAGALTCLQLLQHVHAHYCTAVPATELLTAMQTHDHVREAVTRPFLEMQPVCRADLLGSRCSFDGLVRATRESSAPVYEVRLMS